MTQKRYLEDAYIQTFEADVTEISTYKEHPAVILNETYFYPLGGGQPADIGFINDHEVIDVQIEDGVIYHLLKEPIQSLPQRVTGHINFERRFHYMQQHAGEHILSASALNYCQAKTVGFHIGYDYVTIDLDCPISENDAQQIVENANAAIVRNLDIIAHYPSSEDLLKMPLRKQPKVTENVRVIEIDGYDFSPCGGTHPKKTGEIGSLFLMKMEKYKSGTRLTFICGNAAVSRIFKHQSMLNRLASQLSSPIDDTLKALDSLQGQNKQLKSENDQLKQLLLDFEIKGHLEAIQLEKSAPYYLFHSQGTMKALRETVNQLTAESDKLIIGVFEEENKKHMVIGASESCPYNAKSLLEAIKDKYQVRGGGQAKMAQGGIHASLSLDGLSQDINQALEKIQ